MHEYYKYYFNVENNIKEYDHSDECKKIYKKLALICHPDKGTKSEHIMKIINKAYEHNDIKILKKLDECWEKDNSFDNYKDDIDEHKELTKIDQINLWKRETWYLWYSNDFILRQIFVPQNVLAERYATKNIIDLFFENENLIRMNIMLQESIEKSFFTS
jgi:hypothetical protein